MLLFSSLVAFYGSLLSVTRGAWIAYIFMVFSLIIYTIKRTIFNKQYLFSKPNLLRIFLAFLVFFLVSQTNQYRTIQERTVDTIEFVKSKGQSDIWGSEGLRIDIYRTAIEIARNFPFGVGTDNFRTGAKAVIILDALNNSEIQVNNFNDLINNDLLNSDNLKDTCKYIFEYATTSRCNGKTYARLYIELMEKYDIFKEEFNGNFDSYTQLFDKIESTTQGDNYELFCKLNSINEKRKAFSEFISNLVLLEAVDIKNIEEIILNLQSELIYSVEWNNETPKCEEICENLLIFITNLCNKLKDLESWDKIVSNINEVKILKVNDVISMSNKIKFKHMDMLDAIKKISA